MARLYEFQGKELFRRYGIPVPRGRMISSEKELEAAFKMIRGPVMLKSQVLSGGRGKAGLIQSADCREDAVRISRDLLGRNVQQGNIEKLLVEERLQVEEELYLGITADPSAKQPVVLFTKCGGVDVEEISAKEEVLHRMQVNILKGIDQEEVYVFLKEVDNWS